MKNNNIKNDDENMKHKLGNKKLLILTTVLVILLVSITGCLDNIEEIMGGGEQPVEQEKCDYEHLSLCDNKDDCENAEGYWYNNQCNEEGKELSEKEIEELLASLDKDIKVGEFETFDTDNDGSEDKYVLTFDREEVEKDLFLDKSVEYEKTEKGFMGTLTLEFENTGDETKTYTHTEVIPESFAKSVDDLEFSVPPKEITTGSYKVTWEVQVMRRTLEKIAIKAKNAAVGAGASAGIVALLGGEDGEDAEKAAIAAGGDAALDAALGNLGDFIFVGALNKCSKKFGEEKGPLWNECIINLVIKFPDKFVESDCEQISVGRGQSLGELRAGQSMYGMCKAITTEDRGECINNIDDWTVEMVDFCRHGMFTSLYGKCEYIKDKGKKDECIYNAVVKSNSKYGCKYIADEITKLTCLAELTQDITHCKGINDEDARKYCCDKIRGDARKECLGEEDENLEEDTSGGDTSNRESDCLTPIPKEAIHIVTDTMDYWHMPDGKMVGPMYGREWASPSASPGDPYYKTSKLYVSCYNTEGKKHGVNRIWFSEKGMPEVREVECNYKDGKKHGIYKTWDPDGTLTTECNYKDGKKDGVCKHWDWYPEGMMVEDIYKEGVFISRK
jgi:hypothetical protein